VAQHQSGQQFPLRISIAELPVAESGQRSFVGCLHDLTQAEQQQEQLVQASKLSAIGTLTSGVAHDFNNILGIVRGYAELLASQPDEKVQKTAQNLIKAADRGSALTKSLLDFSSNRSRETVHTELGQLLAELSPMLREACSKERQIQLQLQPAAEPTWVNVEKGGLEDVLLNMVINAVHACQANVGTNGVITVAFAQQQVSSSSHFIEPVAAGAYACLSITDTGCGMTEQVQRKIFEPFFTTKGAKGTGLGLAQVFGFIRRCQGGIVVHSQVGHGTRFELYLPLLPAQALPVSPQQVPVVTSSAAMSAAVCAADADSEILLVDDDAELLEVHGAILEMAGFKVHSCNSPAEALTQLKQKQFRLMVSDIVMPAMNGFELSLAARELQPAVKIQLVSAYADDSLIKDSVCEQLYRERLQKPVRASQLVKRVRELLGE
jgi:signal transduction histidine kinase/CheY-like chemotaxis protein